jgi:hypothetical protein
MSTGPRLRSSPLNCNQLGVSLLYHSQIALVSSWTHDAPLPQCSGDLPGDRHAEAGHTVETTQAMRASTLCAGRGRVRARRLRPCSAGMSLSRSVGEARGPLALLGCIFVQCSIAEDSITSRGQVDTARTNFLPGICQSKKKGAVSGQDHPAGSARKRNRSRKSCRAARDRHKESHRASRTGGVWGCANARSCVWLMGPAPAMI